MISECKCFQNNFCCFLSNLAFGGISIVRFKTATFVQIVEVSVLVEVRISKVSLDNVYRKNSEVRYLL